MPSSAWAVLGIAVVALVFAVHGWIRSARERRQLIKAHDDAQRAAALETEVKIRDAQMEVVREYEGRMQELVEGFNAARGDPAAVAAWFDRVQRGQSTASPPDPGAAGAADPDVTLPH